MHFGYSIMSDGTELIEYNYVSKYPEGPLRSYSLYLLMRRVVNPMTRAVNPDSDVYDVREVEKIARGWPDELERADLARELADAFEKHDRTAIKMSVDRMYREGWL